MIQRRYDQVKKREMNGPSAAVIQYDESRGGSPQVTASGSGYVAQRIKELADEHDIPMEEDHFLLSSLLELDLGEDVPPQLYAVIAEILLLIEEIEYHR
nr:EscU/YscU/HrcU family type III secretion system export apparatus switch protein [Alkalicoccus chagannorensis]